jgi:hypothetical protein
MSDISSTALIVKNAAGDSLPLVAQAARWLAEARVLFEVKEMHDRAAAYERYAKQQKLSKDCALDAAEIKLRCERWMGKHLEETVRPGNPLLSNPNCLNDQTIKNGRLPEGFSRDKSHRLQRISRLPDDIFEAEIKAGRHRGELITSALLKLAKREVKQRKRDEVRQRMVEVAQPTDLIRVGDFREVLANLPDESVDLIFTDPPYAKKFYPLYGDLAKLASRVLKPGGSLIAYAPTYALADILPLMVPHLTYWNSITLQHTGQSSRLDYYRVIVKAKSLLWFVRGRYEGEWVSNLIRSQPPDKQAHEWEQSEVEARYCIKKC